MRKHLLVIAAALLLVACGSNNEDVVIAHENISEEVMNDANQVIAIIDKGRETNEIPDLEDLFVFTDKYVTGLDEGTLDLTDEEFQLVMFAGAMITNVEGYFDGSRDFLYDADRFYKVMETGIYQDRETDKENQGNETKEELYAKMINLLLNEYDNKYELFDVEKGVNLYKIIQNVALTDINVIEDKKEEVLEIFKGDEYEAYSNFFDEVVELEGLFNESTWE